VQYKNPRVAQNALHYTPWDNRLVQLGAILSSLGTIHHCCR